MCFSFIEHRIPPVPVLKSRVILFLRDERISFTAWQPSKESAVVLMDRSCFQILLALIFPLGENYPLQYTQPWQ